MIRYSVQLCRGPWHKKMLAVDPMQHRIHLPFEDPPVTYRPDSSYPVSCTYKLAAYDRRLGFRGGAGLPDALYDFAGIIDP